MTKHQHHSKRKQVRNACLQCRNAHAACCEKRPCERCVALGIADECVDVPRRQRVNKSKLKLEGDALRLDALFERKRSARIAGQKREYDFCEHEHHEEGEACGCAYTFQRRNSYDSDASLATNDGHDIASPDGFSSESEEEQHENCCSHESKRIKLEHTTEQSQPAIASTMLSGITLAQYLQMQQAAVAAASAAHAAAMASLASAALPSSSLAIPSTSCAPVSSPSSTSTSPSSDALSSDFNGYDDFGYFCLEDYGGACCGSALQSSTENDPIQWGLDETIFGQYQ